MGFNMDPVGAIKGLLGREKGEVMDAGLYIAAGVPVVAPGIVYLFDMLHGLPDRLGPFWEVIGFSIWG